MDKHLNEFIYDISGPVHAIATANEMLAQEPLTSQDREILNRIIQEKITSIERAMKQAYVLSRTANNK